MITKRIRIYGIVQGVGFRPTAVRLAERCGISGTVCNKGSFVEVTAQGEERQIAAFLRLLEEEPPARAVILKIDCKEISDAPVCTGFSIVESAREEGEIFIPPDIALCDDCRQELLDPHNRRYLHPFINCTSCGPRLTILESLPYDRERTSMKMFPMCRACREEYETPSSRRYDAQPVCCNACGPEVYLIGRAERGPEAIRAVRRVLAEGGIAAVKGIGGFHLCCRADDTETVNRLRERKHRPAKPFAVMMRDEQTVREECILTEAQRKILTGHQKPILLLERRAGGRVSPAAAPDNPKIGVMLPYAPVQVLLFQYDDEATVPPMLIMTSGNVSGAPICRDDGEAQAELGGLADILLSNDRQILTRCDDSVMDFCQGEPYMIRRSRGYAPLPYLLSDSERRIPRGRTVLAVGGELKNTFCISRGGLFYPSSYIGDLEDARSGAALEETVRRFETLLEARPELVVCDLHPRYHSTAIGHALAAEAGVPMVPVQHHYAHILSCMAENDRMEPVIGLSFDGTGYGEDGTIWGGEILLADTQGFRRLGSVAPFLQIGGDAAAREGWRIAASMLCDFYAQEQEEGTPVSEHVIHTPRGEQYPIAQEEETPVCERIMTALGLCGAQEAQMLHRMHDAGINAAESTSCGRIFDAVSAILGVRRISTFEGEASTALMFRAMEYRRQHGQSGIPVQEALWDGESRGVREEWDCEDRGLREKWNGEKCRPQEKRDCEDRGLREKRDGEKCRPQKKRYCADRGLREVGDDEDRSLREVKGKTGEQARHILRTDLLVQDILIRRLAGEDPDRLALYFHEALAESAVRLIILCAAEDPSLPGTAALSGGCFQNTLLTELMAEKLERAGYRVLRHHLVPPNDGGIALGQALYGSCRRL